MTAEPSWLPFLERCQHLFPGAVAWPEYGPFREAVTGVLRELYGSLPADERLEVGTRQVVRLCAWAAWHGREDLVAHGERLLDELCAIKPRKATPA